MHAGLRDALAILEPAHLQLGFRIHPVNLNEPITLEFRQWPAHLDSFGVVFLLVDVGVHNLLGFFWGTYTWNQLEYMGMFHFSCVFRWGL